MGLNNLISSSSLRRHSWFIILVLFIFLLAGCGESEEAVNEESQAQGVKQEAKVVKEENASDQALTNFIGAETDQSEAQSKASTLSPTQYEKQIENLRTENTSLKQNIVKLEQENRTINARLTEIGAKYTSEKFRADSSEMLVKSPIKTLRNTSDDEGILPPSQSTYDNAMDAFRARRYDSAVRGFKAVVDGGGEDELVSRSKYWLGEAYFAQKNYKEALPLFEDVLKIKNSEKKADAQFMIARSYENLGSKAKAKAAYEKVVKNYPMSKNVKTAKARWAKL
jgi:tol-pal system protein YbgF